MQIDGYVPVGKFEVWLHIPETTKDGDGISRVVPPDVIESRQAEIEAKMRLVDFPQILQSALVGMADEHLAPLGCIATVPGYPDAPDRDFEQARDQKR